MVGLPADAPPDGRLSRHQRNGLCDAIRGRRRPGSVRGRDGAVHPHHRRALKLLSEAVEAIEPGPVEGIRATGANKIEEILYGVLPQVMPLLISYSLYRFESNVRSATVVGMVGAGGIGVTLWEAIRGFQFQQTCALMVLIIVTVSLLDFLSQRLRKHFI